MGSASTVCTSNRPTGAPIVVVGAVESRSSRRVRVEFIELFYLAKRAPAVIAVPHVA
jgi:hypothetical protein